MANIEFPPDQTEDRNGPVVSFPAVIDGKQIKCAISYDALKHRFGATYYDLLSTFTANRKHIEQLACVLIMCGRFEDNGTILIKAEDV